MYLTYGSNGCIIHQFFSRARACQYCFRKSNIKRFDTFEEAEAAALEHLGEVLPYYVPLPERVKYNEMMTVSKLVREFEAKEGHYADR